MLSETLLWIFSRQQWKHLWSCNNNYESKISSQLITLLKRVVESRTWKKFRPVRLFEPMTSAIPVQRSTNWANKPTGSWLVRGSKYAIQVMIMDSSLFLVSIFCQLTSEKNQAHTGNLTHWRQTLRLNKFYLIINMKGNRGNWLAQFKFPFLTPLANLSNVHGRFHVRVLFTREFESHLFGL